MKIEQLKSNYQLLNRESKRIVLNELSDYLKLSPATVQSHYLSRWHIPKGIYQDLTIEKINSIFTNQLNKQNEKSL
tara:strand:- start:114 stop:341 length:228 start_codon:yes stop_codon:yes gene_type:complete